MTDPKVGEIRDVRGARQGVLAVVVVLMSSGFQRSLDAQDDPAPEVELSMAPCTAVVTGPAGTTWFGHLEVRLTTATNPFDAGPNSWSLTIASGGVEIVDITTHGTAGARVDDDPPGLRTAEGFEFSELTSRGCCLDETCSGAISAVALSNDTSVALPPVGTEVIAKLVVRGLFPSEPGQSTPASISFLDGCLGSGTPASTAVGLRGMHYDPRASGCSFELLSEPRVFRRGDANDDGGRDISDALHILGCKFLGERCPDCRDAADSNDDGSVDISDAVHLLSFLFTGGPHPPLPGGACGPDPSEDSLPDCFYLSCADAPGSPFPEFTRVGVNDQGLIEYRHEPTRIIFVQLPRGSFEMGGAPAECGRLTDEEPRHRVWLEPFLIAKHEVTQAEWRAVMGSNPSTFQASHPMIPPGTLIDDLPVESITWNEAWTFCQRASLALPTEAQWEYACRAGSTTAFWFGDLLRADQARFRGGPCGSGSGEGAPLEVGSFPPNGFGLHDLHGNVAEWCADAYDAGFYAWPEATAPDPIRNEDDDLPPFEPTLRVIRGGSWSQDANECRSAARDNALLNSNGAAASRGFRPVWVPRVTLTTRRMGRIRE